MRSWLLAAAPLAIAACATPSPPPPSCAGLSGIRAIPIEGADGRTTIRYTYANEALRVPHLQCRADSGERGATVELARAYETGAGVPADAERAAQLYGKAAVDRPAYTSVYSPPVTLGGAGSVIMIPAPNGGPGDAEAKYRLGRMLLAGRGVPRDAEKGQALVDDALKQGFRPE